MNITRKNFLRLTSASTLAAAIEAALTACGGGGGGGDSTGGSASSSTNTGGGNAVTPGVSNPSSGTGDGSTITPPTSPPATPSVATPSASMKWSDPATWAGPGVPTGYVPGPNDTIYITSAQTVYLDGDAVCGTLTVFGTLRSLPTPNRNISLTTGNINVMASGNLQIGSEGAPFPAAYMATITLTGAEVGRVTRTVLGTNLGFTNSGEGRSIRVEAGGQLSLVGQATSIKRTKLNSTATPSYAAGTKTFTLADTVSWKAGDEIVIGTTDFFGVSVPEKLTLASNASGNTITTSTGIASARWAAKQYVTDSGMSLSAGTLTNPPAGTPTEIDERAFVIHLTRNIVVQGAADATDPAWKDRKFGAHCMFMGNVSSIKLDGVQFRRMGQAGALGRYPIHWHMMSYNMPSGMNAISDGRVIGPVVGHYAKNCSISESSQRMITIHGTMGVTLDSNVGFDITGHAIFLEDGSEKNNVISNNVVMKLRAPSSTNKLLNHDIPTGSFGYAAPDVMQPQGVAGVWFTNPQNTLTGNWINDSEGTGIWNTFATQCFGLSSAVNLNPNLLPILVWQDNVSMGNLGAGGLTNLPVANDLGDTYENPYQGNSVTTPMKRFSSYKNAGGGYSNRIKINRYENFILADNAGIDVYGQSTNAESVGVGFLSVADSLNNTTSRYISSRRAAFATYHELLNFVDPILVGYGWQDGVQSSESGSPIGGGTFRMWDLYLQGNFKFALNTGVRQINCTPPYRPLPPNLDGYTMTPSNQGGLQRNWSLAGSIHDVNGIFVPAGRYWIYDVPFLTYGNSDLVDVFPAGRNGKHTATKYFGVQNFTASFANGSSEPFFAAIRIARLDSNLNEVTGAVWNVADGNVSVLLNGMRHFATQNGGAYRLSFPGNAPATSFVTFAVNDMTSLNDMFLIGVEFSGSVTVSAVQAVADNQYFSVSSTDHTPRPIQVNNLLAGDARVLTAAPNKNAVLNDSTGTLFYQEVSTNTVWLQVKVGDVAAATNTHYTDALYNSYRPVKIAITV